MPESFPSKPFAGTALLSLLLSTFILSFSPQSAVQAQGQELRRMEVERVASNRVAVFQNYHEFAAVMIESSIPGLQIDSNLEIVADLSEPASGVYRVIVHPYRQTLYLRAPGYMEARVNTGVIQARQVIEFTAEPQARSRNLISVIFNVQPTDAVLFVDGQQTPINETVQLPAGTAEIQLEREGYRTLEDAAEISERNISFTYRMEEIDIVPVRIRSNVEGARVTIDGMDRGETDRTGTRALFMYPGTYSVQVSQTGYVSQTLPVQVSETGENLFIVNLVRNIGELALSVAPADATVLINRETYTGQSLIELAPGRYRLEIAKEHYEPHSESIDIALNQRLSRNITLEAHTGSMQFSVTPNDARVQLLDESGRLVNEWTGIQLIRGLKAGRYVMRVSAEGHQSADQMINIFKDQVLEIDKVLIEGNICGEPITDIDGNSYNTVQIGRQCWMAENLNTSRYRDGSEIPNVRSNNQWTVQRNGAWAYYENDLSNGQFFGKLYNWFAVTDRRGLCPEGWRVPSDADWTALEDYLGGRNVAGDKLKERGTQHWRSANTGATNESGFSALPGGWRSDFNGAFGGMGSDGYWWSSSEGLASDSWSRRLGHGNAMVSRNYNFKRVGFSVRCVGD
ncbi:MAG: PEGA domain-containing protein [Balneolales bacterium]|nr:PEGA domain-containing protein [Balneolales bacterium]